MAILDVRTTRVLLTILAFAAALGFAWRARFTLMVFLFAIFFAYLIDPLVERVSNRVHGRGRAIAIVYVAMVLIFVVIGFIAGPHVADQGQHLAQAAPDIYARVSSGQIAWIIGSQRGWSFETKKRLQELLTSHQHLINVWAQGFGVRAAYTASNVWVVLLVPILAIFFLKDGAELARGFLELVDRRQERRLVQDLLNDVHIMLAHFLRAQLILAGLTLVVFTTVLSIMRVPYAVVLGILAGLLEFIPVVGPLAAALLIVGVALGAGYNHVLVVALFLGAWRIVQDYYTSPRIMGAQVQLHPLAALFGILAGAEVAGVVGVYLSIPLMATLRILWSRWRMYAIS